MNTRAIPAIVMLLAGLVVCIIGIISGMNVTTAVIALFITLIIFYFLGIISKKLIDRFMAIKAQEPDSSSEEEEAQETTEQPQAGSAGE